METHRSPESSTNRKLIFWFVVALLVAILPWLVLS